MPAVRGHTAQKGKMRGISGADPAMKGTDRDHPEELKTVKGADGNRPEKLKIVKTNRGLENRAEGD